jgi:hypothetical protein
MFSDGFSNPDGTPDFSKVDMTYTTGVILDARGLVTQSRDNGGTYLVDDCSDLNVWTLHTGGTASIVQQTMGEEGTDNPAGSTVFNLATGSTEGSYCALNRTIAAIPASYGVFLLLAASASTYPNDALQLTIQTTVDTRILNLLLYSGQISVGDDSDNFHSLSTHCPAYACENWIENKDNGDGTNTVSLWQGTEFVGSQTIVMPTQSNPGMVYLQQQSGITPNQQSQVQGLNIGATQLPDAGLLQGIPYTVPFNAQAVNFAFKIEDVSDSIILGIDFTAAVIHNGTEIALTLSDHGTDGMGVVDFTKPVRVFKSSLTASVAQNDTLAYKCHLLDGKLMAVHEVSFDLESIY